MREEKQTKENTFQTSLRIPIEVYEEIIKLADENERKTADQIRFMLKEYIRIKRG